MILVFGLVACGGGDDADDNAVARAEEASDHSAGHEGAHALGDLGQVGTVHFPTSCAAEVQSEFERGVALLHSFFYEEARRVFRSISERDAGCAMAHWGVAMTWYHPVWSPPTDEEFQAGLAALEAARDVGGQMDPERGYIEALGNFFCTPAAGCPAAHEDRAGRYTEAMAGLYARYPDEEETAAFYGLALLGSATPGDTTFENQLKAGKILDTVRSENPNHPGAAHYLIHTFDYPSLAQQGLSAAEAYAEIAPQVPHALHMPSHTFTRVGSWEASIRSNLASAEAARAYGAEHHPGAASFEELHALDYLAYAYLQTARIDEARRVVDRVAEMGKTYPEADFVVAYAMGAIPARFALERLAWQEAAALPIPRRAFWAQFSFGEAHLEFAHALGRTRTGDLPGARRAVERLGQLRDAVGPRFEYFRKHIDLQIQAASGWLAAADGRVDEGVKLLRTAADAEEVLGKHPVSPGSVLPIRELLGHALMDAGRPDEALVAFEAALQVAPGRFAAVDGAARAAEAAGQTTVADRYFRQLFSLAEGADPEAHPALAHARSFLDKERPAS